MKRVLVTGAGGFVGKAVLAALKTGTGIELHAVYHRQLPAQQGNIHWHNSNLLNKEETEQLFEKIRPTHLVQLAWCSEHGVYWKDPANIDWVIASLHMARSFVQYGGQRAVFAGTSAEYQWPGTAPFNEAGSPLAPQSLYGHAKLALYWALSGFFNQQQVSWAWVRLFNPFGPGEDARRLIPKTCLRLLKGEHIQFDAGAAVRDFQHVEDTGAAIAAVVSSAVNGAVNIGSGEPVSIRRVVEMVAAALQCSQQLQFEPPTAGAAPDWVVAATGKLNNECHWTPPMKLEERINEACQWWANYYKSQTSIL